MQLHVLEVMEKFGVFALALYIFIDIKKKKDKHTFSQNDKLLNVLIENLQETQKTQKELKEYIIKRDQEFLREIEEIKLEVRLLATKNTKKRGKK